MGEILTSDDLPEAASARERAQELAPVSGCIEPRNDLIAEQRGLPPIGEPYASSWRRSVKKTL
jgi:hypothetical protein